MPRPLTAVEQIRAAPSALPLALRWIRDRIFKAQASARRLRAAYRGGPYAAASELLARLEDAEVQGCRKLIDELEGRAAKIAREGETEALLLEALGVLVQVRRAGDWHPTPAAPSAPPPDGGYHRAGLVLAEARARGYRPPELEEVLPEPTP